jgi:hypothetical protein
MSVRIKVLDEILNHGLRPWLDHNSLDEIFYSKFHSLKEYRSRHPLQFEIKFERPFDNKTKYYNLLIRNAIKSHFDTIYEAMDEDRNENLIHYYLNDILNKRLKTHLKDLGKLLKEKDFTLSYIDPKNTSYQLDQVHKANTFIMQLLKIALMQLYLEVQETFKEWVNDEFIVEDFYTQLLNEPIPDKLPIKKNEIIEVEPEPSLRPKANLKEKPIQFYSFFYKQYNTNPDKLQDLWVSLKHNNFIHPDTHLSSFKKIFSGTEINTPITWTGLPSDLYYFIKRIHTDLKLVEYLKLKIWEVTVICFVDENGQPFQRNQFRSLKRPNLTGDKIDNIVNLLK